MTGAAAGRLAGGRAWTHTTLGVYAGYRWVLLCGTSARDLRATPSTTRVRPLAMFKLRSDRGASTSLLQLKRRMGRRSWS